MIREQLIGAIAALEQYGSDPVNRHVGLQKLRAQLAALPEPAQNWTDRERRLRELLGNLLSIGSSMTETDVRGRYDVAIAEAREFLRAEAPPPDPRDEALEAAEKWINEAMIDGIEGRRPNLLTGKDALAAIARAKGGR